MAKIIFLQNIRSAFFGVMSISALLKNKSHKTDLFIIDDIDSEFINLLEKEKPDYLGFSLMTGNHKWALDIVKKIKANNLKTKIIFGGVHPTIFPEIIENYGVDIICRGEGEYPLLELLNDFDKGEINTSIKNLWFKKDNEIIKNELRKPMENLDGIPFPDRELYYKYPFFHTDNVDFNSSRACPYACTFCSSKILNKILGRSQKKYFTTKSPECFIEEIIDSLKKYKFIKRINFINEVFSFDDEWFYSFLEKYKRKINLPYSAFIRADQVDEKKIKTFKETGCQLILFGVESGNEYIRKTKLRKNISDEAFIKTAELLHKYKVPFITSNIIGIPEETISQALDTLYFNIKLKPVSTVCSILQPYPKTEISDMAVNASLLEKSTPDNIKPTFYKDSLLNLPDKKEIIILQRWFIFMVKFPIFTPLLKLFFKLPNNKLYELIFLISYFFYQKKMYQRSFLKSIKFGLANIKLYK